MTYLPDVNVLLAAMWARHVHHRQAKAWFHGTSDPIVLCRMTQMSLLRLLTNPAVLGSDALERSGAWRLVDDLRADPVVTWAHEPHDLESAWRALSGRDDRSHKLWTDDYLAAFALTDGLTLVTFDHALARRHPSVRVKALDRRVDTID